MQAELQKEELIQQQWNHLKALRKPFASGEASESGRYNELLGLYTLLLNENSLLKKKAYREELGERVVYEPRRGKRRVESFARK